MYLHSILFFIYYFVFVSIAFFFAPYLVDIGIDRGLVGFLQSLGLFLIIISMLLFGFLTDKLISNKTAIVGSLLISFFAFLGLAYLKDNLLIIQILFIISFPSFLMLPPIIDGLVLKDLPKEKYNFIRAMGSFGAAFSFFLNSYILGELDYSILILANALLILVGIFLIMKIKSSYRTTEIYYIEGLKNIVSSKRLLLVFIISFLTYGTLKADDAYQYIYSTDIVGMTPFILGIVGLCSILLEGQIMIFYKFITRYISEKLMLYLSAFILCLVFITRYYLYNHMAVIIAGGLLLGVFVGLYIPVIIHTINANTAENNKNTMLALYQISLSLGGSVLGYVTAYYYTQTGQLQDIYLLHFFIIAISFVFIFALPLAMSNQAQSKKLVKA